MFIALFIVVFFKKKQNSTDKTEALINGIFDKYDSEEDLEKEIEAELGIDFKFETRQKNTMPLMNYLVNGKMLILI
jgi:hypothetical protein